MKMPLFGILTIATVACSTTVALAAGASGGDPAKGKVVFARCMACHKIDASNTSGLGPNLNKVVGREAGTYPGFRYSPAMKSSGRMWNETALDAYLAAPAKSLPGTRMAFAGVSNAVDRQNVIAYIKSVSR